METDGGLGIDIVQVNGHAVIAVRGEIDLASAPALTAAIEEGLQVSGRVVLDFAEVTFMDSSGLNVLVATAARQNFTDDSVLIRNAPMRVLQLLSITGLDEVIRVEDQPVSNPQSALTPERR